LHSGMCRTFGRCAARKKTHSLTHTQPAMSPATSSPPPPTWGGFEATPRTSEPLFWFLLVVAALRLLSVVLGYFFPSKLLDNVFSQLPPQPSADEDAGAATKAELQLRA
jgi:hypothetical protein